MTEKIEEFLKQNEIVKNELKEWVKDTSVHIKERWNLFIKPF